MQIKHTKSYSSQTLKLVAAACIVVLYFACLSTVALAQASDSVASATQSSSVMGGAQALNSADSLEQQLKLDSVSSYDQAISLLSKEDALKTEPESLIGKKGKDPTLSLMEEEQATQNGADQSTQEGTDQSEEGEKELPQPECAFATLPTPWIVWMKQISSSIEMSWTPVENASGYYIYRCALKSGKPVPSVDEVGKWELVATVSASKGSMWRDSKLKSGTRYAYRVQAYGATKRYYFSKTAEVQKPENCLATVPIRPEYIYSYRYPEGSTVPTSCSLRHVGVFSEASQESYLGLPSVTSFSKSTKSTTLKMTWKKVSGADGYQVQYAKNRLFTSYKTKTVKGGSTTSLKVSGLSKTKNYFARVRAYKVVDGVKAYSPWKHSSTMQAVPTLTLKIQKVQKRNSKTQIARGAKKTQTMDFEIRSSAGQNLGGYDTVQGSTSDGKYGYYMLYNSNVERCKIAKIRLKTMKCVKVSASLPVAHGNAVTYNKKTKRLIVTHLNIEPSTVSCVNPVSLKVEWKKKILFPAFLPGATASQLKKAQEGGFGCVTYNAAKNQYVGLLHGSHNFVIMDQSFTPLRYVTTEWKNGQVNQNIVTSSSYIMLCESGWSTAWNCMAVYTWNGEYVGKWKLYYGAEMESAYFAKGKLYMSIYHSYDKTFTETKYVKRSAKSAAATGKQYVKKRVTYTFPCSNCVYRITNF